ncbi:MAG: repeat-containing protein [Bacteroidetes bacterium]|jgi:hypothetical protein|nr:repeat-containing protein [Bacteroidota bacterium]
MLRSFNKHKPGFFLLLFLQLFSYAAYSQATFTFYENGKFGLKNLKGKILLKAEYDYIQHSDSLNRLVLCKDHKLALADGNGKLITEFSYEGLWPEAYKGLFNAQKNGRWGFINMDGKEVIPFVYDNTWGFEGGVCRVKQANHWGYIDTAGKVIIPVEYEDFALFGFSEGLVGAKKSGKWGFIDRSNKLVIPFLYDATELFSEGLCMVALDYNRWGYIDKENHLVIPFGYADAGCSSYFYSDGIFQNGIAKVCVHASPGVQGYINRKNEKVIPLQYNCLGPFKNGYATAVRGTQFGYIDTAGKEYFVEAYTKDHPPWGIVAKAPAELPDHTSLLNYHDDKKSVSWTMESLLENALHAFREEPRYYGEVNNLKQVCIAMGLLIGGGNYTEFQYPYAAWIQFRKETLFKIIASEKLRKSAVEWMLPYYKKCFQSMHPFHQVAYKEIAAYMKEYMNSYDKKRTLEFLERDERNFAKKNYKGEVDPCRKISAFVDRLILVHKVISVKDATRWVNVIADEVATW